MAATIDVTESELLEALRAAVATPDRGDGLTTPELAQALGWSEDRVRRALRRLRAQGIVEPTRVRRETLSGVMQPVPGYRLVQRRQTKGPHR